MKSIRKSTIICLIISSCLLLSCSAILDFEGKQRDTETDAAEDTTEETEQPDGQVSGKTTLFSDSGGGKAQNDQYKLYGSISRVSSRTATNADYILKTRVIKVQGQ